MPASPASVSPSPAAIRPGLVVLHGNRLELLAEAVFAWLDRAPLGPLEPELLLVQSNGTAEWLKARLAQRRGICAAVRTELPARFIWRAYRTVLGAEGAPAQSPLDEAPLRWRLLRLLPGLVGQPGFEPLARYLAEGGIERRLQLAGVLADLFDQYQVYRADWLRGWAQGRGELRDARGQPTPVPPDQAWQPLLWQALVASVNEGGEGAARPEVHRRFLAELAELAERARGPAPVGLPRRVVVFGLTHLPLQSLQALTALSAHSQVLVAVPNPCRYHWADIIDGREWFASTARRQRARHEAGAAPLPLHLTTPQAHPLLAAWGRQGRDFMRLLDAHDTELPRIDLFDEAVPTTLLQQVQAAVRDLLPLAEHPRARGEPAPCADDRSLVFHVAHSAQREVEVLHGQLLATLGPDLAPRDVVVMVPSLEPFEAAIRAVFDAYPPGDARHIPYAIADLSARGREPLLVALEWLLRAPEPRCTASELRDLLALPALARRFGFGTDDLPRLEHWLRGSGLRWGLDAAHRAALGVAEAGESNTWHFAIQRMLLGYASGEGEAFDGVVPYAEVGGLEAALAGSLAQLFDVLRAFWAESTQARTPAQWAPRLRRLLAELFDARGPEGEGDRTLLAALDAALTRWLEDCARADFDEPVPLAVARTGWLDALDVPGLSQRFTAGGVTFCTLLPMRAIPFQVVCLLGMNEGDYPRRTPRPAFDLMAAPGQRRPGDRAARDDDRYLLLEAVLAARRLLYVSWVGRSVRDHSEQPPSVLVGELRDYLDAGFGEGLSARLTTEHPLQPFSRRYFEPGAAARGWLTQAREWRVAHEPLAATAASAEVPFDLAALLPLNARRLARFLRQPVRAHYAERLGVRFDELPDGLADDEPFGIDRLQESQLLADLLQAAQRQPGAAPEAMLAHAAERLRHEGALPLAAAGRQQADDLVACATPMHGAWLGWQQAHPDAAPALPLRAAQGDVTLEDWSDGWREGPAGRQVAALRTSRLLDADDEPQPHKLIDTWVQALLLGAGEVCEPGWSGLLIGLDACLHWRPPPADDARAALADLLALWREGMATPLPVACRSALAYLKDGSEAAAERVYQGESFGAQGPRAEADDPCLARHWPEWADLLDEGRFDELATRLYGPLLRWVATVRQVSGGRA